MTGQTTEVTKQAVEQALTSKTNLIYTTEEPQTTQDDVNYIQRSEVFSRNDIIDIARDREQESVFILKNQELTIKPVSWALKEEDVVVGMAFISKADIIAANQRKAISPIMRKQAFNIMLKIIKDSYQLG